jgi:hypothetical protein
MSEQIVLRLCLRVATQKRSIGEEKAELRRSRNQSQKLATEFWRSQPVDGSRSHRLRVVRCYYYIILLIFSLLDEELLNDDFNVLPLAQHNTMAH